MKSKFLLPITLAALLASTAFAGNGQWTLIGWNNLGMHCMDDDYSVFTILPPFNTVDAHLIDANGKLVKSPAGLTLAFEAVADPDGSINRTTVGKSNFWDYVQASYGAALAQESGLTGVRMPGPSNVPQPLAFSSTFNWFEALGIPITPVDDAGRRNTYPMMRLTAKSAAGTVLAKTDMVLPVSGEMDCRACHGSGTGDAARPAAGWVNDPHPSRDYRLNILRLHDEKHLADPVFQAALAMAGFRADGLYATVTQNATPILCAKCHSSEALGTASTPGTKSLTAAMHSSHARVVNPANSLLLDHSANRSACYTCHPGSTTRCLRGAMGAAVGADGSASMQCQSCHGTMSQVGAANRTGWLDEPQCGNCHTGTATQNNGLIRYLSVFDTNGQRRQPVNPTFSTNADTPAPGFSLYRFSKGHGGLQCSACHGSTHAEFPAAHRNDNIQSVQIQGHVGVLADCTACHATMPVTINGGPHGMHPTGTAWINAHHDSGKSASCLGCHGADRRGTVLSRAFADRTLTFRKDGTNYSVPLFRGENVSCFICHKREDNGQPGGVFTNNRRPTVTNTTLATAGNIPGSVTLTSSDADGNPRTLRIVSQPRRGAVTLAGSVATYIPEAGFAGPDAFTFAASDGLSESNLGVVSVTVGNPATLAMRDGDGDGIGDLVEYALGLSPDFPSISGVTAPVIENIGGANYLTLAIPRFLPPLDVSLSAEVSGDLLTWQPAVIVTNTPSLLKLRDPLPSEGNPSRFIRLKVTR